MSDFEDTIRSSELDCLSRIAGVEQDIFLTVLRHLDCVSLSQLELTCHSIYNIIQQSEIWRRKYEEAQEEIEVLERERRLNFRQEFLHLDNYPESLYKKVLIKRRVWSENFVLENVESRKLVSMISSGSTET